MQRTKIIATVRDDFSIEKVIALADAGVDVIRMNFTHATPESSQRLIEEINRSNAGWRTHVSLLLDTKWPDIRTGMKHQPLEIAKNQELRIVIDYDDPLSDDIFCDYPDIVKDVEIGQQIVIDSWALLVEVLECGQDYLRVKALNDAQIGSKRHINLPGVKLSLPSMIEKDKADLLFGIKMGFSYVAASFVRSSEHVQEVRDFLDANGGSGIKIISKIENQEALENLEGIVKLSDGVMIARGDLGVELPICKLPTYQKEILDMCFRYGKPVIIATELMKSMVSNPFPTRAEVSDVYTSVIMRADAVMLSDETAIGKYPVKAVEYMSKIVEEAEKTTNNKHKDFDIQSLEASEIIKKSVARHALMVADEIGAKMIVAFSYSGNLASYLSAFKPNQPIIAFTTDEVITYSFGINYGVSSEKVEKFWNHMSEDQAMALRILKEKNLVEVGDYVIVLGGRLEGDFRQPQMRILQVD